ncbi:MAG: hypothetical protein ACQCN6_12135 [Candidatus Bathyarchaeia archaeon]|jgi:hypothetical protein
MSEGWYVTDVNIAKWSEDNPRKAQETLPLLIKRLIFASVNAKTIQFPSGDSIVLPGWDGILKTDKGNTFVPSGESAWEIGTQQKVAVKANADYLKRTQDPGIVDKKRSTFVFVTSKRWPKRNEWASKKKSEAKWADIKVLSAQEIQDWLWQCPAVHRWFARLIGNRPDGAWDAEQAWDDWSLVTTPQCSSDLIIAGREAQSIELSELLSGKPDIVEISSDNKEEAYSFILASIKTHPLLLPRLLVVKNPNEWEILTQSSHSLILLPMFDPLPTLNLATKNGHCIVLPVLSHFTKNAKISLEKPNAEQRQKALTNMGFTTEEAEKIIRDSKCRLHILRRHFKLSRAGLQKPDWASSENVEPLIAALLSGSWLSDNPNDREKISYLAGVSYDELERVLNKWLITGDFPVERLGNKWQVVSAMDSWQFLHPFITEAILNRFGEVVAEVLGEDDPRLELPPEERWLAAIHKKVTKYSVNLRHGLSEGLAILGSLGDRDCTNIGDYSIQAMVSYWVKNLLIDEMSETRWGSLAPELSVFAEASPEIFLQAIETALNCQTASLMSLFIEEGPMGGCPHLSLLRGLEYVSWDLNYVSRAVSVLAKLAAMDPGGKWANRPYSTLNEIFRGWLPQTKASLDKRLEILDSLITYNPNLGWKLLIDLLPGVHEVSTPIGRPQFRNWGEGWREGVSKLEYQKHICAISQRVLNQISKNPEKNWLIMGKIFAVLPQPYLGQAIEMLDKDSSVLSDVTKNAIYNDLTKLISQHRQFSNAEWAIPKEYIDKLCDVLQKLVPVNLVDKYKLLFDNYFPPIINSVSYLERKKNEQRGEDARLNALKEIWVKDGLAGIERLINSVEFPGLVGDSLSRTPFNDSIEQSLFNWLEDKTTKNYQAVNAYIRTKAYVRKTEWLDCIYNKYSTSWSEQAWANFCLSLPFNKTLFDFFKRLKDPIKNEFWKNVNMYYLTQEDAHYAQWVIEQLLAKKRPFAAISAAANYLQTIKNVEIDSKLLLEALESTVKNQEDSKSTRSTLWVYDLKVIIKKISDDEEIDPSQVAMIEWFYMPLYGKGEMQPKILVNEVLKKPEFFTELVCWMFKAHPPIENEFSNVPQTVREHRARTSYQLMQIIDMVPGQKNASEIDLNELDSWIQKARDECSKKNRSKIGDQAIGQILAHSPIGKDNIWPHEAIRDILERYCSLDIEKGIECGRFNQRGVITKSLAEGGKQERKIAADYESKAEIICFKFPRTASMLKRMADTYKQQAIREDRDKELM